MPIYEYRCGSCGRVFERLLAMSAADRGQQCPECGDDECERLLSTFAIKVAGGTSSAGKNCASCSRSSCAGC